MTLLSRKRLNIDSYKRRSCCLQPVVMMNMLVRNESSLNNPFSRLCSMWWDITRIIERCVFAKKTYSFPRLRNVVQTHQVAITMSDKKAIHEIDNHLSNAQHGKRNHNSSIRSGFLLQIYNANKKVWFKYTSPFQYSTPIWHAHLSSIFRWKAWIY